MAQTAQPDVKDAPAAPQPPTPPETAPKDTSRTATLTWQSSDYAASPPQGIEIAATLHVDAGETIQGVSLTFMDYTLEPKGATSTIASIRASDGWVRVPMAPPREVPQTGDKPPMIPKTEPSGSIDGSVEIVPLPQGGALRVSLAYGAGVQKRQVRGIVLLLTPSQIMATPV